MDANKNVTVEGVSGKAAITNATGTYQTEGDYDYVAKTGTRAPQFDLEYTYENGGKFLPCGRETCVASRSAL